MTPDLIGDPVERLRRYLNGRADIPEQEITIRDILREAGVAEMAKALEEVESRLLAAKQRGELNTGWLDVLPLIDAALSRYRSKT